MQCPVCPGTPLQMTERQGVEIDYCPTCRGVWLDRGELDKIIERSAGAPGASHQRNPAPVPQDRGAYDRTRRPDDSSDDGYFKGGQRRKRKSLLGELFDF